MDWTTPPLEPMPTAAPAIEPAAPAHASNAVTPIGGPSLRRMVMTAGLAGLLLVAGGVAAVSAASPDPSSAPSTTAPSGTPGGAGHSSANCPNMGGSNGGSGGSSSSGSSAAPTPAT